MHEPIGFSGVHTVPNSLQSVGRFTPRRMAPHSHACGRAPLLVVQAETFLGVEALRRPGGSSARCTAPRRGRATRSCCAARTPRDTTACAARLPSRVTARVNSFSTSARPSLTWRTSIRMACITSSGSKPAITTGLRYSCGKVLVGPRADDDAHVRRADEAVDRHRAVLAHLGRFEDVRDRAGREHVAAQHAEVGEALAPAPGGSPARWAAWWSRSRWRRTPPRGPGCSRASLQRVGGRIDHADVGAARLGAASATGRRDAGTRIVSP